MSEQIAKISYQVSAPGAEQSIGIFQRLTQAIRQQQLEERKSGFSAFEKTLAGGGIALGITELSRRLGEAAKETRNSIGEALEGKIDMPQMAADFREQLAGSLPILGEIWKTGREIRGTIEDWNALIAKGKDESNGWFKQLSAETALRIANAEGAATETARASGERFSNEAKVSGLTGIDQIIEKNRQADESRRALVRDLRTKGTAGGVFGDMMNNVAKQISDASDKMKASEQKAVNRLITETFEGAKSRYRTLIGAAQADVLDAVDQPLQANVLKLKTAYQNTLSEIAKNARALTLFNPDDKDKIDKYAREEAEAVTRALQINLDKVRNTEAMRQFGIFQTRIGIDQGIAGERTAQLRDAITATGGPGTGDQREKLRLAGITEEFANRRNALLNLAMNDHATPGQIIETVKARLALDASEVEARKRPPEERFRPPAPGGISGESHLAIGAIGPAYQMQQIAVKPVEDGNKLLQKLIDVVSDKLIGAVKDLAGRLPTAPDGTWDNW